MVIEPTVGRVVWYRPVEHEALVHYGECVALIVGVHSTNMINVVGWDANGTFFFRSSVYLRQEDQPAPGDGMPYCDWMPYQIGQAKKHAQETNARNTQEANA